MAPCSMRSASGRPFDQLHHESGLSVGPLESVDRGDVGVIQGREDFGFTLKAGESIDILRHRFRQHFDSDLPLQIRVGGSIHLAHPAGADLGGDFIRAEASTGCESHVKVVSGQRAKGKGQRLGERSQVKGCWSNLLT